MEKTLRNLNNNFHQAIKDTEFNDEEFEQEAVNSDTYDDEVIFQEERTLKAQL